MNNNQTIVKPRSTLKPITNRFKIVFFDGSSERVSAIDTTEARIVAKRNHEGRGNFSEIKEISQIFKKEKHIAEQFELPLLEI